MFQEDGPGRGISERKAHIESMGSVSIRQYYLYYTLEIISTISILVRVNVCMPSTVLKHLTTL